MNKAIPSLNEINVRSQTAYMPVPVIKGEEHVSKKPETKIFIG